jgi:hypothetical protein
LQPDVQFRRDAAQVAEPDREQVFGHGQARRERQLGRVLAAQRGHAVHQHAHLVEHCAAPIRTPLPRTA